MWSMGGISARRSNERYEGEASETAGSIDETVTVYQIRAGCIHGSSQHPDWADQVTPPH